MKFACADARRRAAVRSHDQASDPAPHLNGIDFLEVEEGKLNLRLRFVKPLDDPAAITADKLIISGGERIREIHVLPFTPPQEGNELLVKVDRIGDFAPYTLTIDPSLGGNLFDPQLTSVEFAFHVDCLTEACAPQPLQQLPPLKTDGMDYLAKDYASFRRLMLDRLAALAPNWQARSEADLGITLVELLAYIGDYLSYHQDAIAAEAYLDTARRRTSVRRHARLVDYEMHDGCNARVWVQVQVNAVTTLPAGIQFATQLRGEGPVISTNEPSLLLALSDGQAEAFASLHEATLHPDHNCMKFYTWGDADCRLPAGATQATLLGNFTALSPGDIVILAESRQPGAHLELPYGVARCHPVRLTAVNPASDPLGAQFTGGQRGPGDPGAGNDPLALTEIEWFAADALPFDLHLSVSTPQNAAVIVLGNIVLADHGWWVEDVAKLQVPQPLPALPRRASDGTLVPSIPHYRPALPVHNITCCSTNEEDEAQADAHNPTYTLLRQNPRHALPQVILTEQNNRVWEPRRDLLASDGDDQGFVVELETDGTPYLRFGDGLYGSRPAAGTRFTARVRVGNGRRGNIGAATLAHLVTDQSDLSAGIQAISNPLPAEGGVQPESVNEVRRRAPYAYRRLERAVRPEDYVKMALRHPEVQGAAAELRWTGSWYTIFLAVDRTQGERVDPDFEEDLRQHLDRYRLVGHDLEISNPIYAALEVHLVACLQNGASRAAVLAELRRRLLARHLPGEGSGFFHPDRFTFGQPVYLSALYATLESTPGVTSLDITRFERIDRRDPRALAEGIISTGWCEIAKLDGDPNYPENGILRITLEGGL